jgi:hypothetical protein
MKPSVIWCFLLVLATFLLTYAFTSRPCPKPPIRNIIDVCGVRITEDTTGACWFNNGFELTNHPVKCSDKKKILRKFCR